MPWALVSPDVRSAKCLNMIVVLVGASLGTSARFGGDEAEEQYWASANFSTECRNLTKERNWVASICAPSEEGFGRETTFVALVFICYLVIMLSWPLCYMKPTKLLFIINEGKSALLRFHVHSIVAPDRLATEQEKILKFFKSNGLKSIIANMCAAGIFVNAYILAYIFEARAKVTAAVAPTTSETSPDATDLPLSPPPPTQNQDP